MSRYTGSSYKPRVLKEGFLEKKSAVLKKWRRRYFKLNGEVLTFFKKEEDQAGSSRPMGRIFVADIMSAGKYFSKAKGKDNCFSLDTKSGKTHIMNCSSREERDAWILIVNFAKDDFLKQEESDPVRRRSIRLNGDLKRIKLFKDPTKGIGVRIKSVNGCVFVTRIVEDGPVAETGVLRPGDQILDVDGVNVGNKTIEEVSEVLKAAPILMSCTVKPANHFRYCQDQGEQKVSSYAEIDIDALAAANTALSMEADYEEDQLSNCSDGYVIPLQSDDELGQDNGEHLYENSTCGTEKKDDNDKDDNDSDNEYVNIPTIAVPQPKKEVPPGQRNYLELAFDDS